MRIIVINLKTWWMIAFKFVKVGQKFIMIYLEPDCLVKWHHLDYPDIFCAGKTFNYFFQLLRREEETSENAIELKWNSSPYYFVRTNVHINPIVVSFTCVTCTLIRSIIALTLTQTLWEISTSYFIFSWFGWWWLSVFFFVTLIYWFLRYNDFL